MNFVYTFRKITGSIFYAILTSSYVAIKKLLSNRELLTRGGFHKPIYALRQALTLCAKLLHPKKLLKSWAQSVKWLCAQLLAFMKSTPGNPHKSSPSYAYPLNLGDSKFPSLLLNSQCYHCLYGHFNAKNSICEKYFITTKSA